MNQLNSPILIVIDEKQSIDVASYGNQRIWKFDLMVSEGGDVLLADDSDNSRLSHNLSNTGIRINVNSDISRESV